MVEGEKSTEAFGYRGSPTGGKEEEPVEEEEEDEEL